MSLTTSTTNIEFEKKEENKPKNKKKETARSRERKKTERKKSTGRRAGVDESSEGGELTAH